MDEESKKRLEALHGDFGRAVDSLAESIANVEEWLRSGHRARPDRRQRLRELAAELQRAADQA